VSKEANNRICLSRDVDGTKIEIWFSTEDELRESIILLESLSQRLPVEMKRVIAAELWVQSDDSLEISEIVTNKGQRIALSLLFHYPKPRSNSEIMKDCNLSKDDVYDILSGRHWDMGSWFRKTSNGWTLTKEGERRIRKLVTSLVENQEEGVD
jgi:hypothetical protein